MEKGQTATERSEQEDQKVRQRQKNNKKTRKDTSVLGEFRGIKNISCIKSGRKKNTHPEGSLRSQPSPRIPQFC